MQLLSVRPIALAICLFGATFVAGQSQSYLLRSDGAVRVNGVSVPGTAMVSVGDFVETAKGSVARISAPGVSMFVGENSRVSVRSGFLALDQGSAAVSSKGKVLTGASQYSIAPVGVSGAKYQIANLDGSLSVFSKIGQLDIVGPTGGASLGSGQRAILSASKSTSDYGNFTGLDMSSAQFDSSSGPALTNVCRTAALCYCRTAKNCRKTIR